MIQESFEKEIIVSQFECDYLNRMTAGSILKETQQISTDHCAVLGLTKEVYDKTNTVFLLSKISLEFYRNILVGEKLKITTYPSLPVRAVYHRYTSLCDEEGKQAAAVSSRWVLVDTKTRKILRKPPETLPLPFLSEKVTELDCSIQKTEEVQSVGIEKASYSRTDMNGHLNNAVYADLICDHLPDDCLTDQFIKKMVICYHREVKRNECVELLIGKLEDHCGYYVIGEKDNKISFEANVLF